jgi:hypothetical protein
MGDARVENANNNAVSILSGAATVRLMEVHFRLIMFFLPYSPVISRNESLMQVDGVDFSTNLILMILNNFC